MTAQRKNDATLIIRQSNDIAALTLMEADEAAAELLGLTQEAAKNLPFKSILAERSADYFSDSIDFEPDGADLHEVAQKLRDLRFKHVSGSEFTSSFRLDRIESPDGNGWFRLVLPSDTHRQFRDVLSQYLQQHFAGGSMLNPETNLPSSNAAEEYATMLKNTLPGHNMDGCCALLRLDRYEKSLARYGRSGITSLLVHVANCCKSTFREEDIVCQIDDHTLAMFLVDINRDAARIVLNRLRWNIRNHRISFGGKEDFSVTVSVVFGSLLSPGESMIERCKHELVNAGNDDRNLLTEVDSTD